MTGLIREWPLPIHGVAALDMEALACDIAPIVVARTRHIPRIVRDEMIAVFADGIADVLTQLGGDFDRRVFTHLCGNPEDVTP